MQDMQTAVDVQKLRGAPSPQAPERELIVLSEEFPPPNTPQKITPTTVIIKCGTSTPIIVNCTEEISYPGNREKKYKAALRERQCG
jgi:hypothetical protein